MSAPRSLGLGWQAHGPHNRSIDHEVDHLAREKKKWRADHRLMFHKSVQKALEGMISHAHTQTQDYQDFKFSRVFPALVPKVINLLRLLFVGKAGMMR